jgi:hypothetical protein
MTWGRILFRAESFSSAGAVAWRVFFPTEGLGLKPGYYLMTLAGLLFLALEHGLLNRVRPLTLQRRLPAPILGGTLAATWVVTLMLLPDLSKIFIYFQF